ncbi:MAG: carboxypeptidase-like regulatory domain-containing protein [Bryobacteraceae bacterium]
MSTYWLSVVAALPLICYGHQVQAPVQGTLLNENQATARTVTGTVVNAITGEPLRHALVQLWAARSVTVLTGADGRFEAHNIPEGSVNFSVTKPGFFDSRAMPGADGSQPNQAYPVTSGKNDFRLTLFPAGRIVGRVTDRDGEPVEQTQLQVLTAQINQGHKQWQLQSNASTDEDGSYRIDDLLPGRYIVFAAGHALPGPSWNAPLEVSAPAYYSDASELTSAQTIELQPGQEFRADLRLRAQRGFRVAGAIGGYPAAPNGGLSIALENSTGQQVLSQGVDLDPARGRFVLKAVPSGTWTVALSAATPQGRNYEARQEISVNGADIPNLQILLHPAASIPVTVNHAAATQGEAPQQQPQFNPGINAMLFSADPFHPEQYGMTTHNEPASLSFDNVSTGKYRLSAQSIGNECVESAWYGNVDLLRDYLVVGSDGEAQPLTINLSNDCATLSAKIASDEHRTSGSLVVVRSSSLAEPTALSFAMQDTAPELQLTLAPGSYQVYAFNSLDGLEYANPEVLGGYPSQSVNLAAGQKAEVAVKLSQRSRN